MATYCLVRKCALTVDDIRSGCVKRAAELYPVIKEPTHSLSRQKTQLKRQLNLTDGKMQFDARRRPSTTRQIFALIRLSSRVT